MYVFQQTNLVPGSVVKVWSRRYGFWHKGMIDWPVRTMANAGSSIAKRAASCGQRPFQSFRLARLFTFCGFRKRWSSNTTP